MAIFRRGPPNGGAECKGVWKNHDFDQYLALFRNWSKIEPRKANRKPQPRFRMVPVWMTFSDLFKVMIIQRQITWKWYNIQLYIQWPTNRKSYMIYRTALFSITLNDPYPQFQGHAILWRWISQKWYDIQTQCHWNTIRTYTRPTQQCHFE